MVEMFKEKLITIIITHVLMNYGIIKYYKVENKCEKYFLITRFY